MGKTSGRNFYLAALCIFSQSSIAQDKAISAGVSVQQIYDSNFSQDQLEDEEQITLTSAGVGFKKTFSRQQIVARGRVSNYEHNNYSEFDSTIGDAQFSWKGKWLSQVNTEVEAVRNERLAERVEFFEKDVVRRDHAKINLGYGNDGRLAFHVGAKKIEQGHSNFSREPLDFEEEIVFVDAGYKTANGSTVILRLTSGDVTYINEDSEISRDAEILPEIKYVARDLDFKYRQYELESVWAISSKTELTLTLAQLDRDGFINDGSSELAAVNVQWEATPKLKLQGSYSYRQPAVGEMSDSPANVQTYVISASWQLSEKFSLSSSAMVREKEYEYADGNLTMIETLYNASPFVLTYTPTYALSMVLETGWRENKSPFSYREYSSFQSALSIKLLY
jgi:hypothetical protein